MNTFLDKWLHRVGKLFKIYASVALIAVGIALIYGFFTGPVAVKNVPSATIIVGTIAVVVVVYVAAIAGSSYRTR